MRIECPSEAWDRYHAAEEAASRPSDDEMLDALDAYGHLNYALGFSPESDDAPDDRDGDWLACADFFVFNDGDFLRVATHVVVDSDSAGFTDTFDASVIEMPADDVDPSMLPTDLLLRWLDIALEQGEFLTESEYRDALESNKRFNQDLRLAVWRALEGDHA